MTERTWSFPGPLDQPPTCCACPWAAEALKFRKGQRHPSAGLEPGRRPPIPQRPPSNTVTHAGPRSLVSEQRTGPCAPSALSHRLSELWWLLTPWKQAQPRALAVPPPNCGMRGPGTCSHFPPPGREGAEGSWDLPSSAILGGPRPCAPTLCPKPPRPVWPLGGPEGVERVSIRGVCPACPEGAVPTLRRSLVPTAGHQDSYPHILPIQARAGFPAGNGMFQQQERPWLSLRLGLRGQSGGLKCHPHL